MMSHMNRRHLLRLVLTAPFASAAAVLAQQRAAIQVFADLDHRGSLDITLTERLTASRFGIAAPLPASYANRELLPERGRGLEIGQRLGRLRIEAVDVSEQLSVSLQGDAISSLTLYRRTDDGWLRVLPEQPGRWILTPGGPKSLEIGVGVVLPEAVAGAPDVLWPRAFTVAVGTNAASHQVPFRVAPFIVPTSLDPVDEVLIVQQPTTANSVKALRAMMASTSVPLFALSKDEASDQWMQDAIEPGLFTFPTATGVEQARGVLSGLRKEFGANAAALDRQIAAELRERGTVTVAAGAPRAGSRWIDWFGNLEVTPPHTNRRGRRFPYGRVVIGKQRELSIHPAVLRFLEAQAIQWPPIALDTSWLLIGHADEVVSFVPAQTARGYKVLLPSPRAARTMLSGLVAKGLEKSVAFAGTRSETTVGSLAERVAGSDENRAIDATVLSIREQLKVELDLEDTDFVMVPALFERGLAVIPNAVNSLVFNGHFVAPEPRGPKEDGRDLFEQAIRESLASCDVEVAFVDAWNAYHERGGEIHCGTNTLRRLTGPEWWKHQT